MSACDNFVEQLWRKGKCANCFQSREKHENKLELRDETTLSGRKSKEVLANPHSQNNQTFNTEKKAGTLKKENNAENTISEGASVIKTITPLATRDNNSSSVITESNTSKTEQEIKFSLGIKPKPIPRPKPRLPSRPADSEQQVTSRDENPSESKGNLPVNDSVPHEDSLGKSHSEPQCNAKFVAKTELVLSSIPDDSFKEFRESNNESNIKIVCETVVDEQAIENIEDSNNTSSADRGNLVKISSKSDIRKLSENEKDLSDLKIESESDSDVDGYVPMKRNIVLFTADPVQVPNIHETDVMEPNTDVSREKMTSEPGSFYTTNTCDPGVDEEREQPSCVLEFRNPLCLIANELEMDDFERTNGSCDESNSNEIGSKFDSAESFYVNKPANESSNEIGSCCHDSGYENTRLSNGRSSSSSASGSNSDVATNERVNEQLITSKEVPDVFREKNGYVVMDSSGTSSSSWGSSTWDSCSTSDFPENSCEGLLVEKASGKLNAMNKVDKPQPEVIEDKPSNEQSLAKEKCNTADGHVYENTTPTPLTKPYKVVDISMGVACPITQGQNDLPPLPPKEKDLKKDQVDEFRHHVYLEPSEEAPCKPECSLLDGKKESIPVMKGTAFSSPPRSPASKNIAEKSPAVRRAPAPRPRSKVPSQFGSLPRPAPRISRILTDVIRTENTEFQEKKDVNSPPVAAISPLPDTSVPDPPSHRRRLSFNSNHVTGPTSPLPHGNLDEPSEGVPLSPDNSTVGEVSEGPVKPQRSAPPPPPSAAILPLPVSSVPDPPSHRRRLSFKNSNHVTSPTSPLPHGSLDEPSEGVPLSPDSNTVGEVFEGPVKPQRSAPPPPPSASSPPPPKSPVSQPVTPIKSVSPSASQTKPTRSSTFSGPHNIATATSPTPAKAQPSPKSTLRRAFASMKKFGGKKKNRLSKTLEISAPIVMKDDVLGIFTPKEITPHPTLSDANLVETQQTSLVDPEISKRAEESSVVISETSTTPNRPLSPPYSLPIDALPTVERTSIMQTHPGIGYINFPLSKGGGTLEKPKKPPRVAKLVKPFQHSEATTTDSLSHGGEEPTYLQPNQDEITLKMEAALANLNDAEILAETLSRVEQEKLGPLPAIPRSRQVRFQCEKPNALKESAGDKPDPAGRPMRVVSPTLIHNSGVKDDSKSLPRFPSRPPSTKATLHSTRERSYSFDSRSLLTKKPVVRSRSLSGSAGLEKRYNRILKLQLQTLEEMIDSWLEELLSDNGLDLSDTRWSDYEVCGEALDIKCPGAVLVPVKCAMFWEGNKKLLAKVEYPTSSSRAVELSPYKLDMRVTETIPNHVNISRVLTHFTDAIPGDVIGRADCDSYETSVSISDQIPCETVAYFVKRSKQEHENDPETYEKRICLLMLQLLSAIDHLHREALAHRDLKAENLYLLDCGLLVVCNFQHALQQAKTTRPSPFIISKSAADDLGGNWEHLPPEILNSPEEAALLNYEECDTFAAGCLVYELLHRPNPFAVNRLLIQQDFDQSDLPPIPVKSQFSKGLCTIARQLLQRLPQERPSAREALQMFQVLLWGPRELEDESIESAISDWLETERAHTVAMIARNQMQKGCIKDEFVEMFMKCQFLVDASVETVAYIYQQLDLDK
ncbi:inactive tyrosine-protein kinase PEAK1-like isoform X1 [Montipora capricornis]|uniref:inactive tyrosine-protein kinase PEAK1-like isoform X1 n=1 Tax=Montipora capricornis TaxID=246305 RepID=UPI0035F12DA6